MKIKGIVAIPDCGFANRLRFITSVAYNFRHISENLYVNWVNSDAFVGSYEDIFLYIPFYNSIKEEEYINKKYLYLGYIHMNEILDILSNTENDEKEYDYLIIHGGHQILQPEETLFNWLQFKSQFYKNIIWSIKLQLMTKEFISTYDLQMNNLVSIHIRRNINKYDENDRENNPFADYNNTSLLDDFKKMLSILKSNCTNVLLCTNSNDVKKEIIAFNSLLKNKHNIIIPQYDNYDRENVLSTLNSIVEFIIMSQSKLIIGSYYSSFSDEASYFNLISKIIPINNNKNITDYLKKYHSDNIHIILNKILCINPNFSVINDYFNSETFSKDSFVL